MKFSKGKTKSRARKNYGRKKRNVTNSNVSKALSPFAPRYITKMKYSEAFTLSLANSYTQVMNLNSLFDPNRTGIGHQPYGYDQLAALYNRYRVIGCSYLVNCYNAGAPIRWGTIVSNDVPPINNVSELAENPRAQIRVQIPGGNTTKIMSYISIPKLMGRTKTQYMADDRYQSNVGASPAELALLTVTGGTMTDVSTDILCDITLEYTVEWFDAIPLDQS